MESMQTMEHPQHAPPVAPKEDHSHHPQEGRTLTQHSGAHEPEHRHRRDQRSPSKNQGMTSGSLIVQIVE